jgi:hypothetical protein
MIKLRKILLISMVTSIGFFVGINNAVAITITVFNENCPNLTMMVEKMFYNVFELACTDAQSQAVEKQSSVDFSVQGSTDKIRCSYNVLPVGNLFFVDSVTLDNPNKDVKISCSYSEGSFIAFPQCLCKIVP